MFQLIDPCESIRHLRRLLAVGVMLLCPALAAASVSLPDTTAAYREALVERGMALRLQYSQVHLSRVSVVELGTELSAIADTLAAAGIDTLASQTLHDAGWVEFRTGRRLEARATWTRGLELARRSGSLWAEGPLLNSVAVSYAAAGDLEEGIRLWSILIPIWQDLGNQKGEGKAWGNLANAYSLLGRLPEALTASMRAAEFDRRTGNYSGLVSGYNRRAGAMQRLGRLPEALAHSDSAVAIARRHGFERIMPNLLQRRATLRFDLGMDQAARADMGEALGLAQEIGNTDAEIYCRVNLAIMHNQLGEPEVALAELDHIEAAIRAGSDRRLATLARMPRGKSELLLGRLDDAERTLIDAMQAYEDLRADQADPLSQAGLFLSGSAVYPELAHCYIEQGRIDEAWEVTERGRSIVLRRHLGLDLGEHVDLETLQAMLRASGGALIHFTDPTGGDLRVFVIGPDSIAQRALGAIAPLAGDSRMALDLLANAEDASTCRPLLERLGRELLGAVLPLVPEGTERLYVVPPSRLAGFPFECLPLPGDGLAVGDRYPVTYLPGASALTLLVTREVAAGGQLTMADPARPVRRDTALVASPYRDLIEVPLPYARAEAREISPVGATVLIGTEATRERVLEQLRQPYRVLHFATHTWIDPGNPDRSAMLVAGPERLLTAATVDSLELSADLVTLSGCRTIGGFTYLGEGVFGMSRSFLIAGARTVVSSLWKVEDRATSRFMALFYGALRGGAARDVALLAARRRLGDEGYGARDRMAFVMTGVGHLPVESLIGTRTVAEQAERRRVRGALFVLLVVGVTVVGSAAWTLRRRG